MRQVDEYPRVELLQLEVHLSVLERVVSVLCHPFGSAVQVFKTFRVGFLLAVLEHFVPDKKGRPNEWCRCTLLCTMPQSITVTAMVTIMVTVLVTAIRYQRVNSYPEILCQDNNVTHSWCRQRLPGTCCATESDLVIL
jgi:hypothetical protein